MKAAVLCSGSIDDYSYTKKYIEDVTLIVCCDGGIRHCEGLGIKPDLIVGDFDSLDPKQLEEYISMGAEVVRVPAEKDFTDGELGLMKAMEAGADEIVILGGIGSRIDHTLTNCHILVKALRHGVRAVLSNEHNEICLTDGNLCLSPGKGSTVSLIPLTTEVLGVKTKGLYYPLNGQMMHRGESLGVSNVCLEDDIEISLDDGILVVIVARD